MYISLFCYFCIPLELDAAVIPLENDAQLLKDVNDNPICRTEKKKKEDTDL